MLKRILAIFILLGAALCIMFTFVSIWTDHKMNERYKPQETKLVPLPKSDLIPCIPEGEKNVTEWDV